MMRIVRLGLVAIVGLGACGTSADSRARALFAIPGGDGVDTVTIARAISRDLPVGTSRDSALRLLERRGVGRVANTELHWFQDSVLVMHVYSDEFSLDHTVYGIGLSFNQGGRLTAVEVNVSSIDL